MLFDPSATWKRTLLKGGSYTMKELLIPIFDRGKCVYTSPTVMEMQEHCNREKDTLWNENLRFVNPAEIYVDLSDKLYQLKNQVFAELSEAKYSQTPHHV